MIMETLGLNIHKDVVITKNYFREQKKIIQFEVIEFN